MWAVVIVAGAVLVGIAETNAQLDAADAAMRAKPVPAMEDAIRTERCARTGSGEEAHSGEAGQQLAYTPNRPPV